MVVSGKLIDIQNAAIYPAKVYVEGGIIRKVEKVSGEVDDQFILPGFVDAHVHIESSMLVPTEFARMAVVHGTVATISDPHEIGNVLGVAGVEFMIENGKRSPFKFFFGAPSCVPATSFETAGAEINAKDVDLLLAKPEIKYLAEMMNWPGVLNEDPLVFEKLSMAQKHDKPVDGHAPGLMGEAAKKYIDAGISTDHECFTLEEAQGKLDLGMKVLIREGSAAKNFEALVPLIDHYHGSMMFCSDDKHPDSLEEGHINLLVKRALNKGLDLFKVLEVACINPVLHYDLEVGLLREGDQADFIIIDNLSEFNVLKTYIDGMEVADSGQSKLTSQKCHPINNFNIDSIGEEALRLPAKGDTPIPIIEVIDGELITKRIEEKPLVKEGMVVSDVDRDLLKITVVNRYATASPAVAFVKNFGLKSGAIASSVAHDSHNIIAVGTTDASIAQAINLVVKEQGGLSAVSGEQEQVIPLPIAGLMSNVDGYKMSAEYTQLDRMVKKMGSSLVSPYMSLSFMALLVIPSIKLSDLGLFDGDQFEFIDI